MLGLCLHAERMQIILKEVKLLSKGFTAVSMVLKLLFLLFYLSASSLHCIIKCRGLGDLISIFSLLEKSDTIPWLDNNNGTL